MQHGETSLLSLASKKKFLNSREHFDMFNAAIGLLGAHGWELVSITSTTGTKIDVIADAHEVQTDSQAFWFKRECNGEKLPTIKETLASLFDDEEQKQSKEQRDKQKKQWFGL